MNIQCRKDSNGLPSQWAKSPKKQSEWSVIFVNSALNIHVVKYTLLQTAFSAILSTALYIIQSRGCWFDLVTPY